MSAHDCVSKALSLLAGAVWLGLGAAAQSQQDASSGKTHPDWSGQWSRVGNLADDARTSPPPLTAEYEAVRKRYQALRSEGVPAGDPTARCLPPGMPRVMEMSLPMEIIVTPAVTYIYATWDSQLRRVFTDGRDWPDPLLDTFNGYSIGQWRDENDDGVYDALSIETRGFRGPRSFDSNDVPLHENNRTVVLEQIRLVDGVTLEDKITTSDDAFTRPWTVDRRYSRNTENIVWDEHLCVREKWYLTLGDDWYIFNPENETLEPARRGQARLVLETQ